MKLGSIDQNANDATKSSVRTLRFGLSINVMVDFHKFEDDLKSLLALDINVVTHKYKPNDFECQRWLDRRIDRANFYRCMGYLVNLLKYCLILRYTFWCS